VCCLRGVREGHRHERQSLAGAVGELAQEGGAALAMAACNSMLPYTDWWAGVFRPGSSRFASEALREQAASTRPMARSALATRYAPVAAIW